MAALPGERYGEEAGSVASRPTARSSARVRALPTPANEHYRIDRITGWFMILAALAFDLAQAASKLFLLIGLMVIGAVGGAAVGSQVGLTETGAFIGGLIGTIASATGIGSAAAFAVGYIMNLVFSWAFALLGYAVLALWLKMRGVSIFSGSKIARKVTTFFMALLVDITPLLNLAPGITTWTILMIRASREEDKERMRAGRAVYNRRTGRRQRRVTRAPRPANDNAPIAANDNRYPEDETADAA